MELDHEKLDVYRVAVDIVYGYVNENGNEEDSGQQKGAGDSQ